MRENGGGALCKSPTSLLVPVSFEDPQKVSKMRIQLIPEI